MWKAAWSTRSTVGEKRQETSSHLKANIRSHSPMEPDTKNVMRPGVPGDQPRCTVPIYRALHMWCPYTTQNENLGSPFLYIHTDKHPKLPLEDAKYAAHGKALCPKLRPTSKTTCSDCLCCCDSWIQSPGTHSFPSRSVKENCWYKPLKDW